MTQRSPESEDHVLSRERRERIRERVFSEIEGGDSRSLVAAAPGRDRKIRSLRWTLAGAAAVAMVIGGAVVLDQDREAEQVAKGAAQPLEQLSQVAERARARVEPGLDEAGSRYAHLVTARTQEHAAHPEWSDALWIAADGTGRFVMTVDSFDDEAEVLVDEEFLNPEEPVPSALTIPGLIDLVEGAEPTPGDLVTLHDGRSPPSDLSTALIEALVWPGVSSSARANLFALLDDVGFEPIGPASDPEGRPGAGYRGPGPNGATVVLVIDPETTRPLGFTSDGLGAAVGEYGVAGEVPIRETSTYLVADLTVDTSSS